MLAQRCLKLLVCMRYSGREYVCTDIELPDFDCTWPSSTVRMRLDLIPQLASTPSCVVPSIPELCLPTQQCDQTSAFDLEDRYYQGPPTVGQGIFRIKNGKLL
eukprot:GHVT01037519.1.p3 GENE.GHVT01037519.1~~GHVT01037519.1.p3  ORF type:complete len:103 (-),score=7.56 GHVT01037519.1:2081-2389(-)